MSDSTVAPPALTQLSDDERLFADSVYEFAHREVRPLVREMDEHAKLAPSLLPKLFELGIMGIEIPEDQVPLAIDEFPALFIAAACAKGTTVLRGAEELRVKESDRIQVMADGLRVLGVKADPTPDGIIIEGGPMGSGTIESHGDHRIAMSFAVAALRSQGDIQIRNCANVATSFPNFVELSRKVGMKLDVAEAGEQHG